MEVGTHPPWVSRIAVSSCTGTFVANARELRFIFKSTRTSDGVDAHMLARVGRMDPELLSPIRHRGEEAQRDLVLIRARHALVTARTKLANSVRGLVKSSEARLLKQAAKSLGSRTRDRAPEAQGKERPRTRRRAEATRQGRGADRGPSNCRAPAPRGWRSAPGVSVGRVHRQRLAASY